MNYQIKAGISCLLLFGAMAHLLGKDGWVIYHAGKIVLLLLGHHHY